MAGNDSFWDRKYCCDAVTMAISVSSVFWWQGYLQSRLGAVSFWSLAMVNQSTWRYDFTKDFIKFTSPMPQHTSLPMSISVVLGMSGKRRPKPWDGDTREIDTEQRVWNMAARSASQKVDVSLIRRQVLDSPTSYEIWGFELNQQKSLKTRNVRSFGAIFSIHQIWF